MGARNCNHAHCTLCGKCLTCDPHPPHSKQMVNGRWVEPRGGTGREGNAGRRGRRP